MAEPDAAGPPPTSGGLQSKPASKPPTTLAQIQRDIFRATEPFRAAQRAADAFTAPIRAAAKAHELVLAPLREMERRRRAIQATFDATLAAANPFRIEPGDSLGEWCDREILQEWREMEGWNPPPKDKPAPPTTHEPKPISDAQLEAFVVRIADEVFRRLAAPSTPLEPKPPKRKSRRGRKRREISVGGVDAALEALAAEDPGVVALPARKLAERLGDKFAYTTIQKSPVYKAWRKRLKDMRRESKAFGVSDLLEAGLAVIGTRKPGRRRLVDPTIDPEMEKRTTDFLKAHEGEGLDGQ